MFIIINNVPFKCIEMNVSNIFSLDKDYRGYLNMYLGTAIRKDGDEIKYKILNELIKKKVIEITKINEDDDRIDKSSFQDLYVISPTERIYFNSKGFYLVKHPAVGTHLFCIYDNTHFTISKVYTTREECENARDEILTHVNHIVYELPKYEV